MTERTVGKGEDGYYLLTFRDDIGHVFWRAAVEQAMVLNSPKRISADSDEEARSQASQLLREHYHPSDRGLSVGALYCTEDDPHESGEKRDRFIGLIYIAVST